MSWIRTIPFGESTGRLRTLYDRVRGPDGYLDNILQLHSLRPHSLEGHMALYKNVLHHTGNRLPKWLLEAVGVYVSLLNRCDYCLEHHFAGLRRLLADDSRASAIRIALESGNFQEAFDVQGSSIMQYAGMLTREPDAVDEPSIAAMREAGLDDGEILEVNQVVSYFAYANRTVLGLGATAEGDILGLSPGDSDNPDNWHHG